jgi:hypothetical protein
MSGLWAKWEERLSTKSQGVKQFDPESRTQSLSQLLSSVETLLSLRFPNTLSLSPSLNTHSPPQSYLSPPAVLTFISLALYVWTPPSLSP